MGQVARAIEDSGISTVTMYASVFRKWGMERIRIPRMVTTRFFLGRLLGEPGNSDQQRVVIEDALGVLEGATVPGTVVDLPYRWLGGEDYAEIRNSRRR